MSIDTLLKEQRTLHASDVFKESSNFKDGSIYQEADKNWLAFWERQAENLHWSKKWTKTMSWDKPYAKWFYDGELNASFNC
ncbi:MAG: acetyl-CoA synthetase, partial [Candidatus Marinamargulisbacteria bacterium]